MWLLSIIKQHGKWMLRLYRKLLTHEPAFTSLVVVSALVSQFSMLLAFFLPLKVIILMGSPGVPRYFPEAIAQYSQSTQVFGLGSAAIFFFVLHHVAEHLGQRWAGKGAENMRLKSEKLTLFSNQDEIAKQAYQRFTKNMAAYIFVCMTLLLYAFIYPSFLGLIVAYLLSVFTLFVVLSHRPGKFRTLLIESSGSVIDFLAGVGFLVAFSFIAIDYLFWNTGNILAAIISLLLSRQLFRRLSASINESIALDRQRVKINALFFYEHSSLEKQTTSRKLLDLITSEEDLQTFLTLVHQHLADSPLPDASKEMAYTVDSAQWCQTNIVGVAAFHLELSQGETSAWRLRVHVFHPRNANLALSESDLLLQQPEVMPGLKVHAVHNHQGHHFHYFVVPTLYSLPKKKVGNLYSTLMARLWQHPLEPGMKDRYARTHAQLPDRLIKQLPGGMQVAAHTSEQKQTLTRFMEAVDPLYRWLKTQPTCLLNPKIANTDVVFTCNSDGDGDGDDVDDVRVVFWGRWAIEPIGCLYNTDRKSLEYLPELLAKAQLENPSLNGVTVEGIVLTDLLYALEKLLNNQKYLSALESLPQILTYMEQIGLYVEKDTA